MRGLRKKLIISIIIVLLLSSAVFSYFVLNKGRGLGVVKNIKTTLLDIPSCPDGNELLTYSPVKVDELRNIIPLGNLAPPGHVLPTTHMYYNFLRTGSGNKSHSLRTAIYAPADMVITRMMKMDNADRNPPYISYGLDFKICKQVSGYFILVQELNEKLSNAMQEPYDTIETSDVGGNKLATNWYKTVSVKLKAGELIGWAGGKKGDPDGVDLAIIDYRVDKIEVANKSRWKKHERNYVCSLDYYPSKLSKQLYDMLGDYYDNKVADSQNKCGSVYQDVINTAKGVWVTEDYKGNGLYNIHKVAALVDSNFDPSIGVFSFGSEAKSAGLNYSTISKFTKKNTGKVNLAFELVKPDNQVYCYEVATDNYSNTNSVILLQLSEKYLKIGAITGNSCTGSKWEFSKFIKYIR